MSNDWKEKEARLIKAAEAFDRWILTITCYYVASFVSILLLWIYVLTH
jgi:hypothetical protein